MIGRSNLKIKNVITSIKNGYNSEEQYVKINYNLFTFNLLFFLYKEGYINGFLKKNKKLLIYLKYKNDSFNFLFFFKKFHINRKKSYISLNILKKNYRHSYLYVLTTTKGILNGTLAVHYKLGGLVLFKIFN